MTRDDGRTWFKAAEDPDLQPPVQVEFPGEGVYGLTLVVRSRAGLGRQPPQPGEPPELRVEVDLTPPLRRTVQRRSRPAAPRLPHFALERHRQEPRGQSYHVEMGGARIGAVAGNRRRSAQYGPLRLENARAFAVHGLLTAGGTRPGWKSRRRANTKTHSGRSPGARSETPRHHPATGR
jgi:hypothetical protein